MAITPLDIKKKSFSSQLRGFAKAEVTDFLQLVANEVEELRKERALLAERVQELSAQLAAYERTEKLLNETLLTAQKATNELREQAKAEAVTIIEQAKHEAERIRLEHETQLTRIREQIRELETKRENLLDEIGGIARTYLAMTERHLRNQLASNEGTDQSKRSSDSEPN